MFNLIVLLLLHELKRLLRFDALSLSAKLSLVDSSLTFNASRLGARLRLCGGLTSRLDCGRLRLKLKELLSGLLSLSFVLNLLTLKATSGFLLATLSLMSSSGLLRLGSDFNGELNGLLQSVTRTRVNRLD